MSLLRKLPNLTVGAAALLSAAAAPAANLVPSADFDGRIAGWNLAQGESTLVYDPTVDFVFDLLSGSALVTNDAAAASSTREVRSRCFLVDELESYYLAGSGRILSQSETGSIAFELLTFDDAGCTGSPLASEAIGLREITEVDDWEHRAIVKRSLAAGSVAGRIRVGLLKNESGGSLAAHVDALRMIPLADNLVANGTTEMGSALPWSGTMFSALDAAGDPASGSGERFVANLPPNANAQLTICIDQAYPEGTRLDFSTTTLMETLPGHPFADARHSVLPRDAAQCGGTTIFPFGFAGGTTHMDEFQTLREMFRLPAGTQSVTLLVNLRNPNGGDLQTFLDDTILVLPEPGGLAQGAAALLALALASRSRRRSTLR